MGYDEFLISDGSILIIFMGVRWHCLVLGAVPESILLNALVDAHHHQGC